MTGRTFRSGGGAVGPIPSCSSSAGSRGLDPAPFMEDCIPVLMSTCCLLETKSQEGGVSITVTERATGCDTSILEVPLLGSTGKRGPISLFVEQLDLLQAGGSQARQPHHHSPASL